MHELRAEFQSRYGGEPRIYRAPGRVNLIGEHTDYNEGFVMPAAIEFSTLVAAAPLEDRKIAIHSKSFSEEVEFDLDEPAPQPRRHWSDYPRGVAITLESAAHRLRGANAGELPPHVVKRCRHVVTENDRVVAAGTALKAGDLHTFGQLMGQSHVSLRDDYEVSCAELDLMVNLANEVPAVYGALIGSRDTSRRWPNIRFAFNVPSSVRVACWNQKVTKP